MNYYSYLFETKAIQRFLFANGKLKDMVSGSNLLDALLREPLGQAMKVVGLNDKEQICPRRAGGALYLIVKNEDLDRLRRFRAIWRIAVSQLLPGLEQIDVLASGKTAAEARRNGLNDLRAARNHPLPDLPPASPATARDPRTGGVAVETEHGESIDASTAAKRKFADAGDEVAKRFIGDNVYEQDYHWPNSFAEDAPEQSRFPMDGRSHVALVHADGNGMGQVLRDLNEVFRGLDSIAYIPMFRRFSDGLADATSDAAADASANLLAASNEEKVVPARPLVLGGDDLTLLVRDDLAFEFTEKFLIAFENRTRKLLRSLVEQAPEDKRNALHDALPTHLSACAGIVFMKPAQPFAACHTIAEGLCKRAKKISRANVVDDRTPIPSTIAFHKLKAALMEEADELFKAELRTAKELDLGMKAYAVTEAHERIPSLSALRDLARPFNDRRLNSKRLRRLLTLLHQDETLARSEYQRWREVSSKKHMRAFDGALHSLIGEKQEPGLPVAAVGTSKRATPLADLLVLLDTEAGESKGDDDDD